MDIEKRKQLGNHLFELFIDKLKEDGITQYDLQRKGATPFAQSTIYNLPKGTFSFKKLDELAEYIGVEVELTVRDKEGNEKKF